MKKRILSVLAALCLAASVTACGSSSQTDSTKAESSSSAAESSSAADSSAPDSSSETAAKYDYVHGTDGYYNMFDELKNVSLKVYEVAERVGIPDVSYFNKLFREYQGKTPLQYRKEIMETDYEDENEGLM